MKLIIQTKQNSNQSFGVFEFVGKSWLIQTSPFPIHECERDPETLPVDHSLTPRCGDGGRVSLTSVLQKTNPN